MGEMEKKNLKKRSCTLCYTVSFLVEYTIFIKKFYIILNRSGLSKLYGTRAAFGKEIRSRAAVDIFPLMHCLTVPDVK